MWKSLHIVGLSLSYVYVLNYVCHGFIEGSYILMFYDVIVCKIVHLVPNGCLPWENIMIYIIMPLNLTHGSPFDSSASICNFHFMDYHVMHGFWLKNQDQPQRKSWLNICRFILDFYSWQLSKIYKRITKEKKDPTGPYAINTCSTKYRSGQTESLHVLNKLYVLLNHSKISNTLISCQT